MSLTEIAIDQRFWHTVNFLSRMSRKDREEIPIEIRTAAGDVVDWLEAYRMERVDDQGKKLHKYTTRPHLK
jgi:hypothetical protein